MIKFDSLPFNFLIRIALIPVVAGLSYEIIRLSARKRERRISNDHAPGVWLQNDDQRAG